MSNHNYPPGVTNLPDDNTKLIKHNYEVSGFFTLEIYNNEDKEDFLKENIKNALYDAYKDGNIEVNEH